MKEALKELEEHLVLDLREYDEARIRGFLRAIYYTRCKYGEAKNLGVRISRILGSSRFNPTLHTLIRICRALRVRVELHFVFQDD